MAVSAEPTVIVVGAGIAGASAAWSLAASLDDVTLLELENQPGTHATGRSAAILSETSGLREVCALAVASRSFFTTPPTDFCSAALLSPRGLLWVNDNPDDPANDALVVSAQSVGVALEALDPRQAQDLVPVLRREWVGTALHEPNAMSIDVAQLLDGYVRGFRARGGTVSMSTPALRLHHDGSAWTVDTGVEQLRCDIVINAAGAWADDVAARADVAPVGLQPYLRTAFTFPVDGTDDWPLVMDIGGRFYFEPEVPGLLASPSEETPTEPCDARADELAVAMAVDALDEATTLEVRGVRSRWAGLRSFVPDRLPVVGGDPTAPGFFWLAGQGGAGIKTAPALAATISSVVMGTGWPAQLTELDVTEQSLSPARLRP